MLAETDIVAAIDVGTTKVCTILGRRQGSKEIEVLGFSSVPCSGLRKGNVSDVAATQKAVRESVDQVEQETGQKITSAFVGVTGAHVGFENRRDALGLGGANGVITAEALNRHPESLVNAVDEPGREIIHAIRMTYSLDGQTEIRNPVGMHTKNVEVETHLVTGNSSLIGKLVEAVGNAGIKIDSLVLEPLASALAVLTPEEKEFGAVLVDMGGGTTDLVGFRRGRICYSKVIPVGGWQFTNDIALTFNTSFEAAEAAKLHHATTDLHNIGADERIALPVQGQEAELQVPRVDFCRLVRERAHELARLIKLSLDDDAVKDELDTRLVLTGGASNLNGLAPLMRRNLSIPVREGVPNVNGATPQELKDPAYATAMGILLWAVNEYTPPMNEQKSGNNQQVEAAPKGLMSVLLGRVSRLVPIALFSRKKGRN